MGIDSVPGVKEAVSSAQVQTCQKEGTYAVSGPQGINCSADSAACDYRTGNECGKWRLKSHDEMLKSYVAAVKADMEKPQ